MSSLFFAILGRAEDSSVLSRAGFLQSFFGLSFNFMLYIYFNWTGNGYHTSTIKTRLKTGKENKQNKKKKYVYVHLGAAAEGS